ncbi:hypothetical protein [Flavihumibacter solisilvae]|uniref:Uncharacterized protein n=1 Tax=Flavihumibacter solisilvae TaxID=1349421 RepID=A0A0C1IJQ3_9BACT|nr:hypothetical protein [Flavihumibacter solisilvae]KIC90669.1 hypothetical protein OI18_23210 [Flavihumibacter solisilvae]
MNNRKLFGTTNLVNEFTATLIEIETLDNGWSKKYLDVKTGKYWLTYIVDERGLFSNMMILSPVPTTDELIEISITSKYSDEVSAAAQRLKIDEQDEKKEFRQKLIDRISQIDIHKLHESDKKRIEIIIKAAELTDKVNRRDILGKHFSEIQSDSQLFQSIADRAKEILDQL